MSLPTQHPRQAAIRQQTPYLIRRPPVVLGRNVTTTTVYTSPPASPSGPTISLDRTSLDQIQTHFPYRSASVTPHFSLTPAPPPAPQSRLSSSRGPSTISLQPEDLHSHNGALPAPASTMPVTCPLPSPFHNPPAHLTPVKSSAPSLAPFTRTPAHQCSRSHKAAARSLLAGSALDRW
jgi:hypothetical protein